MTPAPNTSCCECACQECFENRHCGNNKCGQPDSHQSSHSKGEFSGYSYEAERPKRPEKLKWGKGEDIEALSAEVHKLYCAQYLIDHGAPYWSGGDYSKLDERVKEYDRNIVRWHLKLLSERDKQAVTRQRKYDEIQIEKAFIAGAEAERTRILAALPTNNTGEDADYWLAIKEIRELLSPNQTQ